MSAAASASTTAAFDAALLEDDPQKLYDSAPCGYLTTAPDGTVVKANRTFLSLLGFAADEVVGTRAFVELLTAGGRIYHETHYAPMLRLQGRVREVAFDMVRRDGSRLPVLVNAVLERDRTGEPVRVRIAVFDATHRREYERELWRAKERAELSEHRARALARTLQATLIPPAPPSIPDLEVSTAYRPAGNGEEVGGDFYDIFQISAGDWVVALGDVCGKGVDAAIVTALVRHTIRALAVGLHKPSEVLTALNTVLLMHPTGRFSTVVLLRLRQDEQGWSVTMSTGGHPLPLHVRAGEVRQLGVPGSLIGVLEEIEVHDGEFRLDPGDLLVVHTDGVTEARRDREFYGEERLLRAVVELSAHEHPAGALLQEVMDFQGRRARDDIAVVSIRVPG